MPSAPHASPSDEALRQQTRTHAKQRILCGVNVAMFSILHRNDYHAAISDLKAGSPWVILAGSAVSLPEPTQLPMVSSALRGALESLVTICKVRGVDFGLLEPQVFALSRSVKFELFFSILSDYLGIGVQDVVAQVYSPIRPNHNHRALALLAKEHEVFTTNFDENIEACGGTVAHLHGNASVPDSLVVTMERLSDRSRPELAHFEERLLSSRRLACVGYSGWGDIDIYPIFARLAAPPTKLHLLWFDLTRASPPVEAKVYTHNLRDAENVLTTWSGAVAIHPSISPSSPAPGIGELLGSYAETRPTKDILRALASVAHEARHGPLGLALYELTDAVIGSGTISEYEWGVAYERANDRLEAAGHLLKAAQQAAGMEALSHRAGVAFCLRSAGDLAGAKEIYDEVRSSPLIARDSPYNHLDNILRGRLGVYSKLAALLSSVRSRRELLMKSNVTDDVRLLREAEDPLGQRPGRLELLLDVAELEIDFLEGTVEKSALDERVRELWRRGHGLQDLEIESRVARLATAIRRQTGRSLVFSTAKSIRATDASRRDLRKLVGSFVASFLPLIPGRWFLLSPMDVLKSILTR